MRKGISRCGNGCRILWVGHVRCGGERERGAGACGVVEDRSWHD
jgi:hypothetical protein